MPQPEAPSAQAGEPVPPPVAPVPPVSEPPAPVVQPAAPPPTPAAPPAAAPIPTVPATPPAGAPAPPAPAKKKSAWWWWACGGCGCLVVVVLIVVAIVLGMRAANQAQQKIIEGGGTQTTVPGTEGQGVEFGGDTSGPHVKAMRVGDTYDEEIEQVSNVLSEFPPDAPEIHMDADLAGLTAGAKVTAALIEVSVIDGEGNLIQNQELTSVDWEAPDAEAGVHATFTAPDNGWPTGEYVIELSVDGNKIEEAEFMVQAEEGLNQPRTP